MANIQSYRLGELLVEAGHITEQQLLEALLYQRERHIPLGEALISMGYLSKYRINQTMRRQKWLRWIASVVLLVSPLAPVMAKDTANNNTSEFIDLNEGASSDEGSTNELTATIWQGVDQTQPVLFMASKLSGFQFQSKPRFNVALSDDTQLSISFNSSINSSFRNGVNAPLRWKSEIVIDHFSDSSSRLKRLSSRSTKLDEHNRYKNSEPVMYRLTLKGYSLFESVDQRTQYFALNRMRNDPGRKYEVMFSVTQRF